MDLESNNIEHSISKRFQGEDRTDGIRGLIAVVGVLNQHIYGICKVNLPFVIKRCQTRIHRSGTVSGTRYGRFMFDEQEHRDLEKGDGFYLLIAQCSKGAIRMQIIPARALPYRQQRSWHEVFYGGYVTGLLDEE